MSELIVSNPDLKKSKNKLRIFSKKSAEVESTVSTGQMQHDLVDFNNLQNSFIEEFCNIYRTLEVLDKDYIQAISIAFEKADKADKAVEVAQNDITKTIDIQKKKIDVLKHFKEQIEHYKHLTDIDKIWRDSQKSQKDIIVISKNLANLTATDKENKQKIKSLERFKELMEDFEHIKDIDKLWKNAMKLHEETMTMHKVIVELNDAVNVQEQTLLIVSKFKDTLEKYKHLNDVDILWDKTENLSTVVTENTKRIDTANNSIGDNRNSIELLMQYKEELKSIGHLNEVDKIWESCCLCETNITLTNENVSIHKSQIESLENIMQGIQVKSEEKNQEITKKVKFVYVLAAGSIGIAVIEFALLMVGIL